MGFYEGNNYYVTWGHLAHFFEIKSFEELGYTGGWQVENLPFIPNEFCVKIKNDGGVCKTIQ